MIIKSMSRKQGGFLPLLRYINKGAQRHNTAIFHNLRTDPDDIAMIAAEFSDNAGYSPKRKNGVVCYHEILSFPGQTEPHMLEQIAREYLQLRAPYALGYAKLHQDTAHPHIHFCISGNLIRQPTKNRLSRAAFTQVKQQLRHYVKTHYPELLNRPHTQKKTQSANQTAALPPPKQPIPVRPQHQHGQTIKTELANTVLNAFACTRNAKEARAQLTQAEITLYQRGKEAIYGVIYRGKKYRLSTLGIQAEIKQQLSLWERTKQRFQALHLIAAAKVRLKEQAKQQQR